MEIEVDDHYQKVTLLCVDFPANFHTEAHKYLRESTGVCFVCAGESERDTETDGCRYGRMDGWRGLCVSSGWMDGEV